MNADTRHTRRRFARFSRRGFVVACAACLFAVVGCKSNKEVNGTGVSRGTDPLIAGPNLIPKQNVPIPDRATGPKGRPDPLVTPTGGKAGYSDGPDRFKGVVIPGEKSTPAALAGRVKDGEELKIDDGGGVKLTPVGGAAAAALEPPAGVDRLFTDLERYGVKREDRSLVREGNQWVFRANVVTSANGARTEYTGMSTSAAEAVQQVLTQVAVDRK